MIVADFEDEIHDENCPGEEVGWAKGEACHWCGVVERPDND